MENIAYYRQTPIMKRILEYVDGAVYVVGASPNQDEIKRVSKRRDIIEATVEGDDLFRSIIDFDKLLFVMDIEYANNKYPGDIFHQQLGNFGKLERIRLGVKNFLDANGVDSLEIMTGRGYNLVSSVKKNSPSYEALVDVGKKLKVLSIHGARDLFGKEARYGNVPLVRDAFAFGALGRLTDFIFDNVREDSDLLVRSSDIFDNDEMAILDTTQFGYLINRRTKRCAFSLHQKSKMNPKFNYDGPALVTIPIKGIPLEERIKIRSDERDNYKLAVELAKKVNVTIPSTDISRLLTSYLFSKTFERHVELSNRLEQAQKSEIKDKETLQRISDTYPDISENNFMNELEGVDWNKIRKAGFNGEVWHIMNHPNDRMLNPGALRYIVSEFKGKGFTDPEIISLIAGKYKENHGWNSDLSKNDPLMRAEYWVRTLSTQL